MNDWRTAPLPHVHSGECRECGEEDVFDNRPGVRVPRPTGCFGTPSYEPRPRPRPEPLRYPPLPPPQRPSSSQEVLDVIKEVLPMIMPLIAQQDEANRRKQEERKLIRGHAIDLAASVRSAVVMLEELIPRDEDGSPRIDSTMPTATVFALYKMLDSALGVCVDDLRSYAPAGRTPRVHEQERVEPDEPEASDEPKPVAEATPATPPASAANPRPEWPTCPDALVDNLRTLARHAKEEGASDEQVLANVASAMANSQHKCCVKVRIDEQPRLFTLSVIDAVDIESVRRWLKDKGERGSYITVTPCAYDNHGDAMGVISMRFVIGKARNMDDPFPRGPAVPPPAIVGEMLARTTNAPFAPAPADVMPEEPKP